MLSSYNHQFEPTRWSLIVSAGQNSPEGREALDTLCRIYWLPIYAYYRKKGCQPDDARDLTQQLFLTLVERDGFSSLNPEKGRCRSYLLKAATNTLAERLRSERSVKRSGKVQTWSIDWSSAEDSLGLEPTDQQTPEQIFEHRWAMQVIGDAMAQLDKLNSDPARWNYYIRLRDYIAADQHALPYSELARELGVSESALRVQIHRLRKKFRDLLRRNVLNTLSDPADLDDEIAYLLRCLGR